MSSKRKKDKRARAIYKALSGSSTPKRDTSGNVTFPVRFTGKCVETGASQSTTVGSSTPELGESSRRKMWVLGCWTLCPNEIYVLFNDE